ncbi:MAG: hypothetical protein LBI49_13580 [Nocardiopsaceae bacterium]|jgi:hypothetical protein|nr:hypothetical protein [Nocardiopsaceae bacterium]
MSNAVPQGHLTIRGRRDDDLHACERLVQATHLHDRYPVYLGDSARSFLCHPGALSAWVAELATPSPVTSPCTRPHRRQ